MPAEKSVEDRLRALEDRQAIYQTICGYGYAVDGLNAASVGACYVDDGVYAVGDIGAFKGREAAVSSRWPKRSWQISFLPRSAAWLSRSMELRR